MASCGILWLMFLRALYSQNKVTVDTSYGPVTGTSIVSSNCVRANLFLGIPFARPPVGDLRFERPEPPEHWQAALKADRYKASCIPYYVSSTRNADECYSEDCLYLNVITPADISVDSNYPVMVWIHGGSYQFGSASSYSYNSIIDNYISRKTIFVSIQYRLGFLGFMAIDDVMMPGNLGLWDQTAALEFVKKNIHNFGGDPNRITIFGISAGASSASALTLSPYSRDLFSNVIQISGSVFSEWSSSELVIDASQQLVEQLNCNIANTRAVKECLKDRSIEEFWNAINVTGKTRNTYKSIKYVPRIDGVFFPKDLELLLAEAPQKPTITGVAENEGIFFGIMNNTDLSTNVFIPEEQFTNFTDATLTNIIRTKLATTEDLKDEATEVQEKIISFYVQNNGSQPQNSTYWLQQYTKLLADVLISMAVRKEAELKIQNNWPVWLYMTDYYNPTIYPESFPVKGATHAGEEAYLFNVFPVKYFDFDDNDEALQASMLDSFTNFAKTGRPSTNYFVWQMAWQQNSSRHLRFRPQPQMAYDIFNDNYDFWKSLEVFNYNIITGKTRDSPMFISTTKFIIEETATEITTTEAESEPTTATSEAITSEATVSTTAESTTDTTTLTAESGTDTTTVPAESTTDTTTVTVELTIETTTTTAASITETTTATTSTLTTEATTTTPTTAAASGAEATTANAAASTMETTTATAQASTTGTIEAPVTERMTGKTETTTTLTTMMETTATETAVAGVVTTEASTTTTVNSTNAEPNPSLLICFTIVICFVTIMFLI